MVESCTPASRRKVALGIGGVCLAALLWLPFEGGVRRENQRRLDELVARAPIAARLCGDAGTRIARLSALTAAWRSVGGCGAGSSTGVGGIKWVGRNVTGGLVNVQCQGNYTRLPDGYVYSVQNQVAADIGERWNIGVVVPYLYKYMVDPFGLRFDLSNQGLGDVNVLLTNRLGRIRATTVTLSISLPTGKHEAEYLDNYLKQDRQLGTGREGGSLLIDHVIDNLWGPTVIGGTLVYPGEANELENYRAPSASVYAYAGYLLGPLVPSLGISATGYSGKDRDRGLASDDRPPWLVSGNAALEWSTDWMALLVGVSVPYHPSGLQPWTAGIGLALSPF